MADFNLSKKKYNKLVEENKKLRKEAGLTPRKYKSFEEINKKEETLSDEIEMWEKGNPYWETEEYGLTALSQLNLILKQKIQKVQKRIKEMMCKRFDKIKGRDLKMWKELGKTLFCEDTDKIFLAEFGDKLLEKKDG